MPIYSHSKLETFEQCRLKFKYRYIDKIIPDVPKGIEAHLGEMVHKTLEWLYIQVMEKKTPSIDGIITFFSERWVENFSTEMNIVNKNMKAADYFNKGIEFLLNYYSKNFPFKDNTIATEKKIEISLDEKGERKVIGFIDRLVHNLEKDEIEVHDYKTSNSMWSQEKIQNNRQLALYSMAIKEIFGKEKSICLIWHFLAHNTKVCIRKTNAELERLKQEIIQLIEKIEHTKHFPAYISKLCDWCEYRTMCEAWK